MEKVIIEMMERADMTVRVIIEARGKVDMIARVITEVREKVVTMEKGYTEVRERVDMTVRDIISPMDGIPILPEVEAEEEVSKCDKCCRKNTV